MNDPIDALGRVRAHVIAIAKELDFISGIPDVGGTVAAVSDDAMASRLITARAWQRANSARRERFEDGETLFTDPAWELLLDLYIESAEGRATSVSSACLAAKVPTTTGLRWLVRLEALGLIQRTEDVRDKRRIYVSLTPEAQQRTDQALDAAIESNRRLGIGRMSSVR